MAYYSDPTFIAKLQAMRAPGQSFGGPFAATRNAVAQRLQGSANTVLANQLAQQGAGFKSNQAAFQDNQNWSAWGNRLQRAATDLSARERINAQRKLDYERAQAERKAKRKGMLGSAIGTLGMVAGTALGGPLGGAAGGMVGQQLGSSF